MISTLRSLQSISHLHTFRHAAMATVFELYIQIDDEPAYAAQCAREVFDLVDRIEREISRFDEYSDTARFNRLAVDEAMIAGDYFLNCLRSSIELHLLTNGAFDITLGNTIDRFKKQIQTLEDDHTASLRFEFDEKNHLVVKRDGNCSIDFGGIGKGYALDKAATLLREWDVERAMIHGGWSTVLALSAPGGLEGWPVTISHPHTGEILRYFHLTHSAMSGSGTGKGEHIIDPFTKQSIAAGRAVWSMHPCAAIADGLSTAFMIMPEDEIIEMCKENPFINGYVWKYNNLYKLD